METLVKFSIKDGEATKEFSFLKPSRSIQKEAEMIYAKSYANGVRNGMLTNAEAEKYSNDRGGVFTDAEKEDYVKTLAEYFKLDKELKEKEFDKPEDKDALKAKVDQLQNSVLWYQEKANAIYAMTTESFAREQAILFNALSLVYLDGKAYFEGKDFETKIKNLDNASDLQTEALKRGIWYATSLFYGNKDIAATPYPEEKS